MIQIQYHGIRNLILVHDRIKRRAANFLLFPLLAARRQLWHRIP